MDTLETFRHRTHSRCETMQSLSVGLKRAYEMIESVDDRAMDALATEARTYLPAVMTEIVQLQSAIVASPAELAKRAVLFGISTPNRDEVQSLAWAMAAAPHYRVHAAVALTETTYASPTTGKPSRIGLRQSLAKSLEDVYARFDDVRPRDLTPETLERVRGIGPKVARMITAVANPDAHVWTVDLWHIRQLLWAAGLEYRVRASVDARAYGVLERRWLQYRDEHFADVPPFAAQWATWNVADGRHNPHNSLWRDLAA
jgi:3-methyladenine DNA glycosylase/8-oxoguanine DNA glycosylase